MARPREASGFKAQDLKVEAALDKTTRFVRSIAEEEAGPRQARNKRPHDARRDREAASLAMKSR